MTNYINLSEVLANVRETGLPVRYGDLLRCGIPRNVIDRMIKDTCAYVTLDKENYTIIVYDLRYCPEEYDHHLCPKKKIEEIVLRTI